MFLQGSDDAILALVCGAKLASALRHAACPAALRIALLRSAVRLFTGATVRCNTLPCIPPRCRALPALHYGALPRIAAGWPAGVGLLRTTCRCRARLCCASLCRLYRPFHCRAPQANALLRSALPAFLRAASHCSPPLCIAGLCRRCSALQCSAGQHRAVTYIALPAFLYDALLARALPRTALLAFLRNDLLCGSTQCRPLGCWRSSALTRIAAQHDAMLYWHCTAVLCSPLRRGPLRCHALLALRYLPSRRCALLCRALLYWLCVPMPCAPPLCTALLYWQYLAPLPANTEPSPIAGVALGGTRPVLAQALDESCRVDDVRNLFGRNEIGQKLDFELQ